MDVYEAVVKRRTIRQFKDIALPYETLEKCVNAARLAPSGKNLQLCEYVIIDDEQLLPQTFDSVTVWAGQARPTGGPPPRHRPKAYIVTLINTTLEAELGGNRKLTTYDASLANENMMLVALEQGIGACPILSFDAGELKQLLNTPDKYDIALMLALGYPDESPVTETSTGPIEYWVDSQGVRHVPKRKLEDIMHHNKFP